MGQQINNRGSPRQSVTLAGPAFWSGAGDLLKSGSGEVWDCQWERGEEGGPEVVTNHCQKMTWLRQIERTLHVHFGETNTRGKYMCGNSSWCTVIYFSSGDTGQRGWWGWVLRVPVFHSGYSFLTRSYLPRNCITHDGMIPQLWLVSRAQAEALTLIDPWNPYNSNGCCNVYRWYT